VSGLHLSRDEGQNCGSNSATEGGSSVSDSALERTRTQPFHVVGANSASTVARGRFSQWACWRPMFTVAL
jgi:hypothetical protein